MNHVSLGFDGSGVPGTHILTQFFMAMESFTAPTDAATFRRMDAIVQTLGISCRWCYSMLSPKETGLISCV